MPSDLITMRCIKGEEWPATSFKSSIKSTDNPLTEESIIMHCPVGHKFTLERALSKNIFTKEQAEKILAHAEKTVKEFSVDQPSTFLPDKEVTVLNLPCVKCGGKAQRRVGHLLTKVFCLKCYGEWWNYNGNAIHDVLGRTWGRAHDIVWYMILERFIKGLPPLETPEVERLLAECRKQARKSRKKRPH